MIAEAAEELLHRFNWWLGHGKAAAE